MRYVHLHGTDLHPSILGFGCASMMGRVGRKQSLKALGLALDSQINYFDTARSYGYGESEKVIGAFLKGRRDKVILSTKFGMAAVKPTASRSLLKSVIRPVFRAVPGLRRGLRFRLGAQFTRNHFSPAEIIASVEESLRQLQTDYIDILYVHDCSLEALENDGLFATLEDLLSSGKVRYCGLSGNVNVAHAALMRRGPMLSVVQFTYNLLNQEADPLIKTSRWNGKGKIAHQLFGGEVDIRRIRDGLVKFTHQSGVPAELKAKLGDMDESVRADVALNAVLQNTGIDVALCSMFKEKHLRENVRAVEVSRFSSGEIIALRSFFRQI